jgi:hypothetical protein
MNLTPYVESLREQLVAAAESGGPESRATAERLVIGLEAVARLVLLEALSAAADEITRELAPGSVEVRLRGRDPELVVAAPVTPVAPVGAPGAPDDVAPAAVAAAAAGDDEGGTARLNLRLPEGLKARIEEAAHREGRSLNAWLVRAAAAAVEGAPAPPPAPKPSGGRSFTGWVR